MEKLEKIISRLEVNAPLSLCEEWDNSGLLVGDKECMIDKVMVVVDVTMAVLEEAVEKGANLIVSHHPIIFAPIKSITQSTTNGRLLLYAISHGINIYSMHTNLDSASGGINSRLAVELGLGERDGKDFCYRTGKIEGGIAFGDLASKVRLLTGDNTIKTSGNLDEVVERVAIISGAGGRDDDFVQDVILPNNIQVFITAEVKHSLLLTLVDNNVKLIELGHWTSEKIAKNIIYEWLRGLDIQVEMSCKDTNPYNN